MATLAELVADGTPFLDLEDFAETITFRPANGSQVDLAAVVDRRARTIEHYDDGDHSVFRCRIYAAPIDLIALGDGGDGSRFVIDGLDWAVEAITKKDVGIITIDVLRRDPLERARREFRQQR